MHRAVSVYDLMQFEKSREVLLNWDESKFLDILFEIGFDLEREIEKQVVNHRPLTTNKEFFGVRWVGEERKDKDWMESDYCTPDNKLEAIGVIDLELQRELLDMARFPQWTQRAMDYMKDSGLEAFTIRYATNNVYLE